MSFVVDVDAAVEALLRVAIPDLVAGERGVSRELLASGELVAEQLPHASFGNFPLHEVPLRFGQRRVTLRVGIQITRQGATHAAMLADFDAVTAALRTDPTMGGACEKHGITMTGLSEPADSTPKRSILTFEIDAVKVLS